VWGILAEASSRPEIGVPLGLVMGLMSGLMAIALFRTIKPPVQLDLGVGAKLIGELSGIAVFLVGGPWATDGLLKSIDLDSIIASYMISAAGTFGPVLLGLVILFGYLLVQDLLGTPEPYP
jgi:hypothetical protein